MYQVPPGDGQLIVHVASISGSTSSHSKAGIMIRSSLDPGAREATQDFEPASKEFLYRQTQGGTVAPGYGLRMAESAALCRAVGALFAGIDKPVEVRLSQSGLRHGQQQRRDAVGLSAGVDGL